jgi:toxin ParE1/3/4
MANYFLTNKAVEDLSGIWNYTYENWSEQQADKYYELLIDTCRAIAEKPAIGKHYDAIDKNILGYRTNQHIIFYRIIAPGEIEVLRILHGRMDLKNRIQE